MQCTSCMCEWDADEGFYRTADGAIAQPCKVCRCDSSSVYYWNNAEAVREAKRTAYYADLEAKRAYYRTYRQARRRALATA